MSLESKASIARPKSKSLRATIPEGIVAFLEMQAGDILEWKMDIAKGERVVIVRKSKQKEK
jgi:DNA-binding Xre family transcriptional regulator